MKKVLILFSIFILNIYCMAISNDITYIDINNYPEDKTIILSDFEGFIKLIEEHNIRTILVKRSNKNNTDKFLVVNGSFIYEINSKNFKNLSDLKKASGLGFSKGDDYYDAENKGITDAELFIYYKKNIFFDLKDANDAKQKGFIECSNQIFNKEKINIPEKMDKEFYEIKFKKFILVNMIMKNILTKNEILSSINDHEKRIELGELFDKDRSFLINELIDGGYKVKILEEFYYYNEKENAYIFIDLIDEIFEDELRSLSVEDQNVVLNLYNDSGKKWENVFILDKNKLKNNDIDSSMFFEISNILKKLNISSGEKDSLNKALNFFGSTEPIDSQFYYYSEAMSYKNFIELSEALK